MRILHTSDWHLGKKLNNFDRLDEQKAVMQEIIDIANEHDVDMAIVAGDLFDTYNPSNEAQRLLYTTLYNLSDRGKRPVIAIAGNHDSPDRIESPETLAYLSGIFMLGYPDKVPYSPEITNENFTVTKTDKGLIELYFNKLREITRVIYTPFTNAERLRTLLGETSEQEEKELRNRLQDLWTNAVEKHCDENSFNILVAHQFLVKNEDDTDTQEPEDENAVNVGGTSAVYTSNIPAQIHYTALGHLHRCHAVANNIWYSGSPLEYSFAETQQEKFVLITDFKEDKTVETQKILLNAGCKLTRMNFNSIPEAVEWLNENKNIWVELTIKVENYLTSVDKKTLYQASEKIVSITPVLESAEKDDNKLTISELSHNKKALFEAFFEKNQGTKPDKTIMQLFNELTAQQ